MSLRAYRGPNGWYVAEVDDAPRKISPEFCLEGEDRARASAICCGCGQPKGLGLLVCWPCFKHQSPNPEIPPLKYSGISLRQWVEAVGGKQP